MSETQAPREESRTRAGFFFLILLVLAVGIPATCFWLMRTGAHKRWMGKTKVQVEKNKGYRLLVNGEPFFVRGVCYNPIPAGKGFEYNFWGKDSPALCVDGELMQQAHINTVRFYRAGKKPEDVKAVVRGLYEKFGIHTLLGHHLGFWEWPPAEYADPEFRERIRNEVIEMVTLYKDEPGILGWVLGNENNYSFDIDVRPWTSDAIEALPTPEEKRRERAKIYYSWINEMAREVKKIDPDHPVVMGVGETKSLDLAAVNAPDIDILGMIAYRGPGFGNLFREVKQKMDKPLLLIEFGCDRFNAKTQIEEENYQAEFIKQQWREILKNSASVGGARNSVGGTLFEWSDEWWKGSEMADATWGEHDAAAHWRNAAYYFDADDQGLNNMNEEWWGIVRVDPHRRVGGHDARVPVKAYRMLKEMWKSDR